MGVHYIDVPELISVWGNYEKNHLSTEACANLNILLGKYLEVSLLRHTVSVCYLYTELPNDFPKVALGLDILISKV